MADGLFVYQIVDLRELRLRSKGWRFEGFFSCAASSSAFLWRVLEFSTIHAVAVTLIRCSRRGKMDIEPSLIFVNTFGEIAVVWATIRRLLR